MMSILENKIKKAKEINQDHSLLVNKLKSFQIYESYTLSIDQLSDSLFFFK